MSQRTTTREGIHPGTLLAGRYRVIRRAGSGGMGEVYEVEDQALENERLALKLFSPQISGDGSLLARFRQEVLITRKLSHPNIVRTYEFGELTNGCPYITMEFVDGASLDQEIKRGTSGIRTLRRVVEVLASIADGMSYAHEHGIVHRDLKSANVLIGKDGTVKVADFGLARSVTTDLHLTQSGECIGTPAYMAPEQIQGHRLDQRVDIYALGIIAYEIAMGRVPFQSQSWFNLASEVVHKQLPTFASEQYGIPQWYEDFVHRAAAKNPDHRFQTARECVHFLSAHGGIEGKLTWRPTPQRNIDEQTMPSSHSNSLIAVLSTLACCLLLAVIGVATFGGRSVTEKSDPVHASAPLPKTEAIPLPKSEVTRPVQAPVSFAEPSLLNEDLPPSTTERDTPPDRHELSGLPRGETRNSDGFRSGEARRQMPPHPFQRFRNENGMQRPLPPFLERRRERMKRDR